MLKRILILLISISTIILSCAGEEKTCVETGCDEGKHCVVETKTCVEDCTVDSCATINQGCSQTTKECKPFCSITRCEDGFICDELSNDCKASCLNVQCSGTTHCNTITEQCDDNCTVESCVGEQEVCDPESNICIVKAEIFCEKNSCEENSHCNSITGYCVGGCIDIECSERMVCNPSTLTCINKCEPNDCIGQSFCNLESKLCEAYLDYPSSVYGKEEGDTIENISWIDIDGQEVSLLKYYSMYKKTGYPKVIMLIQSEGWCGPCRQETPFLKTFYDEMLLKNGFPRLAIVDTVTANNYNLQDKLKEFAISWRDQYNLSYPVIADTKKTIVEYNRAGGIPFKIMINAKTMKIENLELGMADETLELTKSKVKEIEKTILCENLNCNTENGQTCNVDIKNGSAQCN